MTTTKFEHQAKDLSLKSEKTATRPADDEKRRARKRRRARRMILAYKRSGDPSLRDEICRDHIGLVKHHARRHAEGGADYDDLCQEGCLGLLAALEGFDPSLGSEFSTYASRFIEGRMKELYRTKAWPCSAPRSVRDMSLRVRMLAGRLGREPSRREVLDLCGIPAERADDAMIAANAWHPVCLHQADVACDVNPKVHARACLPDAELEQTPARLDMRSLMERALEPEELAVVRMRHYDGFSQREIAERLGTYQMHVSRTLQRSICKLGSALAEEDALAS